MARTRLPKGQEAEEALRSYFLSAGYFVVRNIPFTYAGYDITDLDLWLYKRVSLVTRERINADIKRKKTPQVMERIFWAKGLQGVLGLDKCIVATTDKRRESRDFGAQHDVIVLDGEFLQRTIKHFASNSNRISEEAFLRDLEMTCTLDSRLIWKKFYRELKEILLNELSFNGSNLLLEKTHFLFEEYVASNKKCLAALRLIYATISYFLITVDFRLRLLSHKDSEARKNELTEGFRYGEAGRNRSNEILNTALKLLSDSSSTDLFARSQIESEIEHQLNTYPAEILGEHFSKNETVKITFPLARQFEAMAFDPNIANPDSADLQMKSIVGLLSDFFRMDRKSLI